MGFSIFSHDIQLPNPSNSGNSRSQASIMGEKGVVSCPIANPPVQTAWINSFSLLQLSREQEIELGTRGIWAEVEDQSGGIGGSCDNRRLTTTSNLAPKWSFFVLDRTDSTDVDDFAEKWSSEKDFRGDRRAAAPDKGGRGRVADLTKEKLLFSSIEGEDCRSGESVHKEQLLRPIGSYQLRKNSPRILCDLSSDKPSFKKILNVGLN